MTAILTLLAFLGATGASLDQAFREAAREAVGERLEAQVYALLGTVDVAADGGVEPPSELGDPRLRTPESGLYAWIRGPGGDPAWRSPSSVGVPAPPPLARAPGQAYQGRLVLADGTAVFIAALTVRWELASGALPEITVQVAEHQRRYLEEVAGYRRTLWGWLLAAGVGLLLVQGAALVLLLRPLRHLEREVTAIEAGEAEVIEARYPQELQPLVNDLNILVAHGRSSLARSREALDALAHSLKTPLAVLEGSLREIPAAATRAELGAQLAAMREAVDYQLQRASVGGRRPLAAAVDVAPLVERLARSLAKVHDARGVDLALDVPGDARFRGDAGDFTEILGNLLDNAYKWARGRVRVAVRVTAAGALLLQVEDDGPGLPAGAAADITARGARLDPAVPGHGLGLAIVRSIVAEGYGGALRFAPSPLGGLRAEVELPE